MAVNTSRVVENYASRKPNHNKRDDVDWENSCRSIFCHDRFLYSYGHHYTLAVHVATDNPGHPQKEKHVFVKNGDRFSRSTGRHISETQSQCAGPTVSGSALRSAGIDINRLTMKPKKGRQVVEVYKHPADDRPLPVILDWQEDSRTYVTRNKKSGKFKHQWTDEPFTPPNVGMFMPHSSTDDGKQVNGVWHILGAVTIQQGEDYFLCSMDDRTYFVAQLPGRPRNIQHAFTMLQPPEVRKAIAEGAKVLRQGEWFFVPTGLDDRALAAEYGLTQKALREQWSVGPLPLQDEDQSNHHECRQFKSSQYPSRIYVRGKVFHRQSGQFWERQGLKRPLSGEHPTLDLGQQWYLAYRNREIASWTESGQFD